MVCIRRLTPPELSRAGLVALHNLDHLDKIRRTTGDGSREVVRRQHRQLLAKWPATLISGKSAAIKVGSVAKTKILIVAAKNTTHDGNWFALRNQIHRQ